MTITNWINKLYICHFRLGAICLWVIQSSVWCVSGDVDIKIEHLWVYEYVEMSYQKAPAELLWKDKVSHLRVSLLCLWWVYWSPRYIKSDFMGFFFALTFPLWLLYYTSKLFVAENLKMGSDYLMFWFGATPSYVPHSGITLSSAQETI